VSGGKVLGYVRTERPMTWDDLRMVDECMESPACHRINDPSGAEVHAWCDTDGEWTVILNLPDETGELWTYATEAEALAACAFLLSAPATEEQG